MGLTAGVELAIVNPIEVRNWDCLVQQLPGAGFFDGSAWARVLQGTYGHQPAYIASFAGDRLLGTLPVMEVSGRLLGRRGVSLPFTDSCFVLSEDGGDTSAFYRQALSYGKRRKWRFLECRGGTRQWQGSSPSVQFYGHRIELEPNEQAMLDRMGGATRRALRKAGSAGLKIEFRQDEVAMRTYFELHCLTRKRQGIPPQPWRFFQNIARHVMEAKQGFVAIATAKRPVAAAVFFSNKREAVYKFGASDYRWQELRANNLVMWESMKRLAREGIEHLSLGRTSIGNEGLRRFKVGFGAREQKLDYCRYDLREELFVMSGDGAEGWGTRVFRRLPLPLLRLAGRMIYPHLS